MTPNQINSLKTLLPCPCCASEDIIPPPEHWREGCVYCRSCGLRAVSPDAWNQRTPSLLDALEAGQVNKDAILFASAMLVASAENEGEFVADVSGEFHFQPSGFQGGSFPAWHLRALADELDRRNAPLQAQIEDYFSRTTPTGENA